MANKYNTTSFLAIFSYVIFSHMDRVYQLKTIVAIFLMLVPLKKYEFLKSCRVLCLCRVKQIRIDNNYYEYINSYFITP